MTVITITPALVSAMCGFRVMYREKDTVDNNGHFDRNAGVPERKM